MVLVLPQRVQNYGSHRIGLGWNETALALPAEHPCCHFSYGVQHSYTAINLTEEHVRTDDVWYMNGNDLGSGTTVAAYLNLSEVTLRDMLLAYFTTGVGAAIKGGLNTTNAVVMDIETPVNLKLLGLFLDAERRDPRNTTYDQLVVAHAMRARVLREVLPRAQVGFYGSPNGPDAFAGENFTLSMEALRQAATRGIFDRVSFLMPVPAICPDDPAILSVAPTS